MRRELTDANRRITELLGVTPESFAYPCGQTFVGRGVGTQSYVPVVASVFVTSRGWLDEAPNDPSYVDFAQLTGIESDGKDFEQILAIVEAARQTGSWVVLGRDTRSGKELVTQTTRLGDASSSLCAYANDRVEWCVDGARRNGGQGTSARSGGGEAGRGGHERAIVRRRLAGRCRERRRWRAGRSSFCSSCRAAARRSRRRPPLQPGPSRGSIPLRSLTARSAARRRGVREGVQEPHGGGDEGHRGVPSRPAKSRSGGRSSPTCSSINRSRCGTGKRW